MRRVVCILDNQKDAKAQGSVEAMGVLPGRADKQVTSLAHVSLQGSVLLLGQLGHRRNGQHGRVHLPTQQVL